MYNCYTLIFLQRKNAHVPATSREMRKQAVEHSGPTPPLGAPWQPVVTKNSAVLLRKTALFARYQAGRLVVGLRFERYNIVGLLTVTAYTVPSPSAM
jgi:hypothetical protein